MGHVFLNTKYPMYSDDCFFLNCLFSEKKRSRVSENRGLANKSSLLMNNNLFGFKCKIYGSISRHSFLALSFRAPSSSYCFCYLSASILFFLNLWLFSRVIHQQESLLLVLELEHLKNLMLKMRMSMPLVSIGVMSNQSGQEYIGVRGI